MPDREQDLRPRTLRWVLVVWPAFLAACLLEALVFSMVDPGEIRSPGMAPFASQKAAYTVAFFCFWLICSGCSALVLWLAEPLDPVNGSAAVD